MGAMSQDAKDDFDDAENRILSLEQDPWILAEIEAFAIKLEPLLVKYAPDGIALGLSLLPGGSVAAKLAGVLGPVVLGALKQALPNGEADAS